MDTYTFTEEEMYDLMNMANDALFAWRKRCQMAQGKIDLNVPGNIPENTIREYTVEECKEQMAKAKAWYDKLSDAYCGMR